MGAAEEALERAEGLLAAREVWGSVAAFAEAERAGADADRCAGGRWWAWMLLGEYERAWGESDAIRARGAPDAHRVWDGRAVEPGARVLVRSVHGFGDLVQMARFLPRLRASWVCVQCAERVVELARLLPGVDAAVAWGVEPEGWDVQVEVNELAYCVRATVADVGEGVPYLRVGGGSAGGGELAEDGALNAGRALRVGLVWTGGGWNPSRWVPFGALGPLLRVAEGSGVELWSLQQRDKNDEWRAWWAEGGREALVVGEGDVMGLARAVEGMDLVIAADTFAAHLAGAMGKPCWVMLEREADWRWMVGREDSPWYPSVRLWRQERQGEWGAVVERVATALRGWSREDFVSG